MHVTLVPYIKAAGELKTKPTQQSVAKLREIGLQPQVLICRSEHPLDDEVRQKLSMFCNVPLERGHRGARRGAHHLRDAADAARGGAGRARLPACCTLEAPPPDMADWRKFVERIVNPKKRVKIAVVGKYIELQDAYKSIYESLTHAAASQDCGIDLDLSRRRVARGRR